MDRDSIVVVEALTPGIIISPCICPCVVQERWPSFEMSGLHTAKQVCRGNMQPFLRRSELHGTDQPKQGLLVPILVSSFKNDLHLVC